MNATGAPALTLPLGRIVATSNALEVLSHEDIMDGIRRHQAGDWGEVGAEDRQANDRASVEGTRILSAYRSGETTFWIITEADRSVTTVLLPEDC
ncbi:MAG: hypothetical protein ACLQVY_12265 [Limisphaerales bacterium]